MTATQLQNELHTSLCDELTRLRGLLKQERRKKELLQYRGQLIAMIKQDANFEDYNAWEFEEVVLANETQVCLQEIGYLREELKKCLRLLEQVQKP